MAKNIKKGESLADAESVKMARKQRWNPLRSLSPLTLTRALDALEYGDLREFAMLAEVVADRDDTLKSVKPKREKAVSRRDWTVMKREKSPQADAHADILEEFWNNVRAENAYDRNERGGMSRLIKQMMTAVSYRYACHHIVWKPQPGKLRAVFEFVPLWFFENRTGRLRFVKDGVGIEGEDMDEREWMVTTGDGLMVACLIGYLAKRYSIQDWLAFSEKFSMPGTLGRTSAAKGSDAGNAMKSAVESFGQDWAAVIYGDDGNSKIELVQPNGNPSAMPMPALIERVDRKMAALYRGADLSSMSSAGGEGTGASLQSEESDILEADDCEVISETLQEVEREVIAWHFGKGVEPLAYIQIQPPVREDKKFVLEAGAALVEAGVRVAKKDYLERLGFAEADDDEDAIGENSKSKTLNPKEEKDGEANAYNPDQARNPAGSEGGGRWVSDGSAAKDADTASETGDPLDAEKELAALEERWKSEGIKSAVYISGEDITLSKIIISPESRGKGIGTAKMTELLDLAQKHKKRVLLTPSTDFGASSKSRLVDFYRGFGFKENKGQNKDFTTRETMIWEPDESSDDLVKGEINSNSADIPQPLSTALAADLQPLGDALFGAIQAGDLSAKKDYLERLGFAEADDDEDAIGENSKSETLNPKEEKDGESNVGGWRTMPDGQKVFIPELKNPTERDGGSGYRDEPTAQQRISTPNQDASKDGLAVLKNHLRTNATKFKEDLVKAKEDYKKHKNEFESLASNQPRYWHNSNISEDEQVEEYKSYEKARESHVDSCEKAATKLNASVRKLDVLGYDYIKLPSDQVATAPLANKSRPGTDNRREGLEIYENIVHKDLIGTNRVKFGSVAKRAHAYRDREGNNVVSIGSGDNPSVVVHELVHGLERGETLKASVDFLQKRAKGESLKSLRALTGSNFYRKNETAYEDSFASRGSSHYAGKIYKDGTAPTTGTEILTVGVQRLLKDPVDFMEKDEEYFDFVVKTLQKR